MNKNHLLPSLLFVLAACGGTTTSSSTSTSTPPPLITEWALVGTFNGWKADDESYQLVNDKNESKDYELYLNLFQDEEFKFVKNGAWGGDLGFAALLSPNATDIVTSASDGNIKVVRSGAFRVKITVATSTTPIVTRLGDVSPLNGGLKLVGTIQDPVWKPETNTFPLTFDGGMYYGRFNLPLNAEVKVKNGTSWNVGFDAGFSRVASMPTGAFSGSADGNIKALIAGNYRFAVRVVGQSLIINISHSFSTYGGMTATESRAGSVINYVNSPANFWESGALVKFVGVDATKTALKVDFTGVLNTTYLFKFEKAGGNNAAGTFVEFEFVGTGAAQTANLSLTTLTAEQRATMDTFVVFVKTPATTGAVTISRIYYA
jgi:hypothetical protein